MKMLSVLLALQFLTILPIRIKGAVSPDDLARSAACFPLAGAIQGGAGAVCAWLLSLVLPVEVVALVTLLVLVAIIGGFHLDGLADTLDALAVKSSPDKEADQTRRLQVMKDGAVGPLGAAGIALVLLFKYVLFAEILAASLPVFGALLILMGASAKWAVTAGIYHGNPARNEGLGRIFLGEGRGRMFLVSSLVTGGIFLLVSLPLKWACSAEIFVLPLIYPLVYLFVRGAVALFRARFGGLTGDSFGAINEISEIIFLLSGVIWLQPSIS